MYTKSNQTYQGLFCFFESIRMQMVYIPVSRGQNSVLREKTISVDVRATHENTQADFISEHFRCTISEQLTHTHYEREKS